MNEVKLLIADDENHYLKKYSRMIEERFPGRFKIITQLYASKALATIGNEDIQIVVTDMNFNEARESFTFRHKQAKAGLDIVEEARSKNAQSYIIFLSSWSSGRDGAEAIYLGANKVIDRPKGNPKKEHYDELLDSIDSGYEFVTGAAKQAEGLSWIRDNDTKWIVGSSKRMTAVYQLIDFYAGNSFAVTIQGETGSGKDLVAEAIHFKSSRIRHPFVKVNCAKYGGSGDLARSEILGIGPRVATGVDRRDSIIGDANHGTLFLDEYQELPHEVQVLFHNVFDDQNISGFGIQASQLDVRLITATLLKYSEFAREDTLRRLGGERYQIAVPSLRHRKDDILPLIRFFVSTYSISKQVPDVEDMAVSLLEEYDWPGNVGELKELVKRGVHLIDFNVITPVIVKRWIAGDVTASYSLEELNEKFERQLKAGRGEESKITQPTTPSEISVGTKKDCFSEFLKDPQRWVDRAAQLTLRDLSDEHAENKHLATQSTLAVFAKDGKYYYGVIQKYYQLKYCDLEEAIPEWVGGCIALVFWQKVEEQIGTLKRVLDSSLNYLCSDDGTRLSCNTIQQNRSYLRRQIRNKQTEITSALADGVTADGFMNKVLRNKRRA